MSWHSTKTGGLFIESNVHEILSLSSIFLLAPGSHSNMMIDIFSSPLLNKIHQQFAPVQQIELSSELTELSNDETLGENLGFVILKGLELLPSDKWPNTALNESKARKFRGRAKQPDFVVSIVHQSQTVANIFIGEVSPPSQKTNVYKNCCDLIRLGIFMKDCMDFKVPILM
ncbi:unnamed protein product [Rhizophagus irregularis]|nr:unnamed protein product [Rhizophagus irregularis]